METWRDGKKRRRGRDGETEGGERERHTQGDLHKKTKADLPLLIYSTNVHKSWD